VFVNINLYILYFLSWTEVDKKLRYRNLSVRFVKYFISKHGGVVRYSIGEKTCDEASSSTQSKSRLCCYVLVLFCIKFESFVILVIRIGLDHCT